MSMQNLYPIRIISYFLFDILFIPARAARVGICALRIACVGPVDIIGANTRIFPPSQSSCPSGNPTSFAPLLSGRCVQMRFSIDQPAHAFRTSVSREGNISSWHKDAAPQGATRPRLTSQEDTYTPVTETARLEFHFHCARNIPTHRALPLRSHHYRLLSRRQLKSILCRAFLKEIAVLQIIIGEQISDECFKANSRRNWRRTWARVKKYLNASINVKKKDEKRRERT